MVYIYRGNLKVWYRVLLFFLVLNPNIIFPNQSKEKSNEYDFNFWGSSRLSKAIEHGNAQIVADFLKNGGDPNLRDESTYSLLMKAADDGQLEIVKMLLSHGSDPNLQHDDGFTALEFATMRENNLSVIDVLLNANANPNMGGQAPVIRAISDSRADYLRRLLQAKANPNMGMEKMGNYSIYGSPLVFAIRKKRVEMAEILINSGADVNFRNPYSGETALIYSIMARQDSIVKNLLKMGADPNIQSKEGGTPLMAATRVGNVELVQLLLKHGALRELKTKKGNTALILAKKDLADAKKENLSEYVEKYNLIIQILSNSEFEK